MHYRDGFALKQGCFGFPCVGGLGHFFLLFRRCRVFTFGILRYMAPFLSCVILRFVRLLLLGLPFNFVWQRVHELAQLVIIDLQLSFVHLLGETGLGVCLSFSFSGFHFRFKLGFSGFQFFYLLSVFFNLLLKIFHTGKEFFEQCEGFVPFLSGVQYVDVVQRGLYRRHLFGELDSLFKHPRRYVLSVGFAGEFAAFKVGIRFHHVSEIIVLPFRKPVPVSEDFFRGEPAVIRYRSEAEVHMRRFLVHVDDGGEYVTRADLIRYEIRRSVEERPDFLPLLALEELRAGGDERVHETNAVLAGLAPRRVNPAVRFPLVGRFRFDDMEIVLLFAMSMSGLLAYFSFVRS